MYVDMKMRMDFSEALHAVKGGETVCSMDWVGPDGQPFMILAIKHSAGIRPYLVTIDAGGTVNVYNPSMRELLDGTFYLVKKILQ